MQIRHRLPLAILSLLLVPSFVALKAQHPANSNATYQQLRSLLPGDDVITVDGLRLRHIPDAFG